MTLIPTAHLDLVLRTPAQVIAQIEAMSPADRAEVSPDWLARVRVAAEGDPWLTGFVVVERASGLAVGSCGFKGPPDADGVVEIAYSTGPAYRGRGYATEAARALAEFAFVDRRVRLVRAHTQQANGASAPS
jgi:RimJ/RimL family protein N-acetyltransferase